jgi:hypothetical protein
MEFRGGGQWVAAWWLAGGARGGKLPVKEEEAEVEATSRGLELGRRSRVRQCIVGHVVGLTYRPDPI